MMSFQIKIKASKISNIIRKKDFTENCGTNMNIKTMKSGKIFDFLSYDLQTANNWTENAYFAISFVVIFYSLTIRILKMQT